ncbi:MAG: hypothetical protein ACREBR_04755 [bacterium]
MSWDQEYKVPSLESLLQKLTGKVAIDLLVDELARQCVSIKQLDNIMLDDGMYEPIYGTKITLSDGRVFIPKLKEKYEENGNHGIDIYEYFLEDEAPEVLTIGLDSSDPDIDVYTVPEGFGEEESMRLDDDGGCGF